MHRDVDQGKGQYQGCFMISGKVMRCVGSTTNILSSRSQTSLDRASLLSRMKGDSIHCLFTSCSLHSSARCLSRQAMERSSDPCRMLSQRPFRIFHEISA